MFENPRTRTIAIVAVVLAALALLFILTSFGDDEPRNVTVVNETVITNGTGAGGEAEPARP